MNNANRVTRAKAIRLKCLDCSCGQLTEIRECPIKDCALWCYRMGYEVDKNGKKIKFDNNKEN